MADMKSLLLLPALAAAMLLGACNAGTATNPLTNAPSASSSGARPFQLIPARDSVRNGIYVSSLDDKLVLGFRSHYHRDHGHGPFCTIYARKAENFDIAADPEGNLIVPQGVNASVAVYGGPAMCGPRLGQFKDQYGLPADAASFNAATGTIVVSNLYNPQHELPGNVAICTLKGGCTEELQLSFPGYGGGVALAKNGDCWVSIENQTSTGAAMSYWPGCTGSGETVTGFMNTFYGSLSIDKQGNLVSVDAYGGGGGQLWVYSGCNPGCTLVGGPFPLQHNPIFGALNAKGDRFGVMETEFPYAGNVDIYTYSPTKLTYEYSFASHYAPPAGPTGFAYSPALDP
jgi:hypothetical protein